jgi:hypothetical protein
MPERIQRKRTKGWVMPEGAIYVGRPSRWKNPYKVVPQAGRPPYVAVIDKWGSETGERWSGFGDDREAAAFAVDLFHRMLLGVFEREPSNRQHYIGPLVGHDLACWCSPGSPCHADVLLRIANGVLAVAS